LSEEINQNVMVLDVDTQAEIAFPSTVEEAACIGRSARSDDFQVFALPEERKYRVRNHPGGAKHHNPHRYLRRPKQQIAEFLYTEPAKAHKRAARPRLSRASAI